MNSSYSPNQDELNRQLIDALIHNDTETALALVNEGADPNTRCEPDPEFSSEPLLNQHWHNTSSPGDATDTAFMIACGTNWNPPPDNPDSFEKCDENLFLLQAMVANGADVNAKTLNDRTALHDAVTMGRWSTVELLLQYGADVNAQDEWGTSPLMYAAWNDRGNVARLLLAHGATPNLQDVKGNTALGYTLSSPIAISVIPELLSHGADPSLRAKNGYSPLTFAHQAGLHDIVRLLKRRGK